MTLDGLRKKLSKYGDVQMLKDGYVFTLLITGKGLSDMTTWLAVQKECTDYVGDRLPVIECFKNEEDFYLVVLKPKPMPTPLIFPFKKNVSLLCDLSIGETIIIKDWGYKLDGEHTIEDIKPGPGESGILIKISGYPDYIDSGWATKKEN